MTIQQTGNTIGSFNVATGSATSDVSVTATSSATGNTCVTTGAFSVVNPGNYLVEVFAPYLTIGTTNIDVELFDGASAAAGTFLQTLSGHAAASVARGSGCNWTAVVNLAAGAHNMTVTAFVDAGTGHFGADTGATGHAPPARINVQPA